MSCRLYVSRNMSHSADVSCEISPFILVSNSSANRAIVYVSSSCECQTARKSANRMLMRVINCRRKGGNFHNTVKVAVCKIGSTVPICADESAKGVVHMGLGIGCTCLERTCVVTILYITHRGRRIHHNSYKSAYVTVAVHSDIRPAEAVGDGYILVSQTKK